MISISIVIYTFHSTYCFTLYCVILHFLMSLPGDSSLAFRVPSSTAFDVCLV